MTTSRTRKLWLGAAGVAVVAAAGTGVWVWQTTGPGSDCAGQRCQADTAAQDADDRSGERPARSTQVDLGEVPGYDAGPVVVDPDGQLIDIGAEAPVPVDVSPVPDGDPTPGAVLATNPGPLEEGLGTWTQPDGSYRVVDTTADLPPEVVAQANERARQALSAAGDSARAAALEDLYLDLADLGHDVVLLATNHDGSPEVTTAWVDADGNLHIDIFTALGQDKTAEVDQKLRTVMADRGEHTLVLDLR